MPKKPRNPLKPKEQRYSSRFLRNSARSLGFVTKDALTQIAPNLMSTVTTGTDVAREAFQLLGRNKSSLEKVNAAISSNKYAKAATEIYKNAMSDIKSGKFWNEDRGFGGGDDTDGGFSFGDEDAGDEGSLQASQEIVSSNQQISASLDNVGDQIQRNGLAQIKVMKASTDAMLAANSASIFQTQQIGTEINSHLTNIENQMAAIVEFQNNNMMKFIESSLGYYEKVGASYSDSNKAAEEKAVASNVIKNGGIDMAMYKKYIKSQFKDSSLGQLLENSDMILDQMRANPIGTTMSLVTQFVIPKALSNTIKGLEKGFNKLSTEKLLDLGEYGKNSTDNSLMGMLKRTIAQTFGIVPEKSKRDLSGRNVKVERGPIPFDGETKHAITQIITNELREQTSYIKIITEHLTKEGPASLKRKAEGKMTFWDWNTNSYITGKGELNKSIANKLTDSIVSEFEKSDLGEALRNLVESQTNKDGSADEKAQKELKRVIDEFYVKASRKDGPIDAETLINIIATQVGGKQNSRNALIDFIRRLDNENRDAISSSRLSVVGARGAYNKAIEELLSDPNILHSTFNNEKLTGDRFDKFLDKLSFGAREEGGSKINTKDAATISDENREIRDALKNSTSAAAQYMNRLSNSLGLLKNGDVIGSITEQIKFLGDRAKIFLFGTKDQEGKNQNGIFSDLANEAHDFMFGDGSKREEAKNKAKSVFGNIKSTLDAGFLGWQEAFFGKKEVNGRLETDEEFKERINNEVSERLPNMEKGMFGGAIVGGLLGNPFLGAAVGGAMGLASRSDWFQDLLFGKEDENGERTIGGIINKRVRDWFKDNKKEIGKSATIGSIGGGLLGMVTGGPILGALLGGASGIIAQTGTFKRFLYGDPENGQTGLIRGIVEAFNRNKKRSDEEIKKDFGKMAIGAGAGYLTAAMVGNMGILGAALTPFGPIGGAIAGLALAIKSQGTSIREYLFGKDVEEIDGKKFKGEAGVVSKLFSNVKVNFINPIMTEVKHGIGTFFNHLEHHFLSPIRFLTKFVAGKIGDGIGNITSTILKMSLAPFKLVGNLIGGLSIFGTPLSRIGGVLANGAMNVISAPGQGIKNLIKRLDPTMAGEIEADDEMFKTRRDNYKDLRRNARRHDKNAKIINRLTKGRYNEDTSEAREYIKRTDPKNYYRYFEKGDQSKNTTLDQESNAHIGENIKNWVESGSVPDGASLEERQLFYAAKMQKTMDLLFESVTGIKENQEEGQRDLEDRFDESNEEYEDDMNGGFFSRLFARAKKRHRDRTAIKEHKFFGLDRKESLLSKIFGAVGTGLEDARDVGGGLLGSGLSALFHAPGNAIRGTQSLINRVRSGFGGRGPENVPSPKMKPIAVNVAEITVPDRKLEQAGESFNKSEENAVLASGNEKDNKYDTDGKTAEELREEKVKLEEREETKEFRNELLNKVGALQNTEEEKKWDWRSIFSKKGLLTAGLIAGIPLVTGALATIIKNIPQIIKAIKWIGDFIKNIADGIAGLTGRINAAAEETEKKQQRENGDSAEERLKKLKNTANPFDLFDDNGDINHMTLPKIQAWTALLGKLHIPEKTALGILKAGNGAVGLLGKGLTGLGKGIEGIPGFAGKVVNGTRNFGKGVAGFADNLIHLPGNAKTALGNFKTGIGNAISGFDKFIGGQSGQYFVDNADDVYNLLVSKGMDPNAALAKVSEMQTTGSRNLLGRGIDVAKRGAGKLKGFADDAINMGKSALAPVTGAVDDVGRFVGSGLSAMGDDIAGIAGTAATKIKNTKVVTKLMEGGKALANSGLVTKVIEMCKSFFTNVLGKIGAKLPGAAKILGGFGKSAIVGGTGLIGKFFKAIGSGISKIATKVSAVLSSKTVGAIVSFGLSEAGFITMGALNGLTGAAKLFHVKVDKSKDIPDTTMQIISAAIGGLAQTIPGAIVQICSELYYDVSGVDIISEVATMIYNAIMKASGNEDAIKTLEEQKEALDKDYIKYQEETTKQQYEAQKKAGIVDKDVSYEDFMQGVKDNKYQVNYDSKADYNTKTNASFGDKLAKGAGKAWAGFKNSGMGKWIFGKKETSYKYNGMNYKKNEDTGLYDAYDEQGKKIEEASGLAEEALKNAKGVEEVVNETKSGLMTLIGNIGKGLGDLWKRFEPVASEVGSLIGSYITTKSDLFGFMIKGDLKGLWNYNPMKNVKSENSFVKPIVHVANFIEKMATFPGTIISSILHKVGNVVGKIIDKAKPAVDGVIKSAPKLAELADKSDVAGIWKEDIKVDSDNPMGLIGKAVLGISKMIYTAIGLFNVVFKPVQKVIGTVFNTIGKVIEAAEGLPIIGDLIKGVKTLWNGSDEGGSGTGVKTGGKGKGTNDIKAGGKGGNGSTYYSQNDPRWKDAAYNIGNDNATMGDTGCGPTALSMAISDATGKKVNPTRMAGLAELTGDRDDTGTNWNFVNKATRVAGVNSQQVISPTASYIDAQVSSGHPVVLSGKTGGYGMSGSRSAFTNEGHYVYVSGKDNNGNWIINDPRGRQYSGSYNPLQVASETGSAWSLGGNGTRRGGRGNQTLTAYDPTTMANWAPSYQQVGGSNTTTYSNGVLSATNGSRSDYQDLRPSYMTVGGKQTTTTATSAVAATSNDDFVLPSAGSGKVIGETNTSSSNMSGYRGGSQSSGKWIVGEGGRITRQEKGLLNQHMMQY